MRPLGARAFAAAIVAGLLAGGCTRPSQPGGSTSERGTLTVKGSDTMVHLVTDWAEAYMTAHPDAQISITGGGSGTGIAAMLNGTADLCMSSRDVKPEETAAAEKRGISFHETPVAMDGLAIVVHPDNPIRALTMDQLRQIYNGTLDNFQQVGGPELPIQALSRESNSGTYVFFNEHVLMKDDFGRNVRLMPSSAQIVQAVGQDRGSIGYVGLGYAGQGQATIVAVRHEPGSPAVLPSIATVQDETYPIARPLYFYSNGKPAGLAAALVDFALSPEGQKIVEQAGYIPLK